MVKIYRRFKVIKRGLTFVCIIFLVTSLFAANPAEYVTGDMEADVENLLQLMTLEEKLGQLTQYSGINNEYRQLAREGKIGSFLNVVGAKQINEIQKLAVEESRLGIPIIFGLDIIHGYRTITPIPLAEVATWDPELVEQSARMAAVEGSAAGLDWTFAPMVDIARDARWGRISEGAGEDPYLGSIMAAARVRGFQGEDLESPTSLAACAKHFAAYGAAIAGKDYNTTDMSVNLLHNVYLPPFKAAEEAGVLTYMCAFNDLNGVPCSANEYLLNTILRQQWGFDGFVVSDYESISDMVEHGNVTDSLDAALKSLPAGVDMEMVSGLYQKYFGKMHTEGRISEDVIDEAVKRVLRVKFKIGLFENPYADPEREKHELVTPENRAFARKLAAKSMVLLKNEKRLLPLKRNIKSIALIGPLVKNNKAPLGGWHCQGKENEVITPFNGINRAVSDETKIYYAKGCDTVNPDKKDIEEAVATANKADVVVLVVGEPQNYSGEGGSRATIDLPGAQDELVKAVQMTNKKVVMVIMAGRPLELSWYHENIQSILYAWQPGTECGNAIADVIFGDINPGGKLPTTFPRVTGQEPVYYNHKNSGRPGSWKRFTTRYIDLENGPLYPFGYGLSYTTFKYENLVLDVNEIQQYGKIKVTADITNTGKMTGDEIAQLYIRDLTGSITRPVRELKGFQRITLKPGETRKVEFLLDHKKLGFYNADGKYVVEPGDFKVWLGPNSTSGLEGDFTIRN